MAIQPASDADDTILDNEQLTTLTVLNETKNIADWSILSMMLGVDDAAVRRIRKDNPGEALNQQKAIIMLWLNTGKASWAILVSALREELVGRAADGNRIANAHPRGAKPQQPTSDPPVQPTAGGAKPQMPEQMSASDTTVQLMTGGATPQQQISDPTVQPTAGGAKPQMPAPNPTIQPTTESPSPTPKKELNRKMINEYKLRIENLTQEHKFTHAKGIIFVVGIFGASGTAEDVENITSTFKELKFAVFSERDLTAEKIACLVAAAAECNFPYKYRYIAFYFAGHGGTDESGEPFIVGLQADFSKKEILHINDFIVTPWKDLRTVRLFFFDCCQFPGSGTAFHGDSDVIKRKPKLFLDNDAGDSGFIKKKPKLFLDIDGDNDVIKEKPKFFLDNDGASGIIKKKPRRYPGEVVAFASNKGKMAFGNVIRGGVWTYYLCKNLRKPEPITTVLSMTFDDVRKVQEDFQEPVSHATIGTLVLCEDAVEQEDIDPEKIMMKIPDTDDVMEALEGVTTVSVYRVQE